MSSWGVGLRRWWFVAGIVSYIVRALCDESVRGGARVVERGRRGGDSGF